MFGQLLLFLFFNVLSASVTPTELTCYTFDGKNYRGTVNRTVSGNTCQSWSAQTPHNHTNTPDNYPHGGLDKNYCRNPTKDEGPWCYTTASETRWEYCPVPRCEDAPRPASETPTIKPELYCYTSVGKHYQGTVNRTVSGNTCQSWSAQKPHNHTYTPDKYPRGPRGGLDKNYCRNRKPSSATKPWCYTTDPKTRWDYCPVPRCEETKQVLKLKLTPDDPTVDLNDPALMEAVLKQMEEKLKQRGVSGDVKLTWKEQPDGKVFKKEKEKNRMKTDL